jgi:hypothetical protein
MPLRWGVAVNGALQHGRETNEESGVGKEDDAPRVPGSNVIVAFGRRAYGRVEVIGETFVVTQFQCLNLLPFFPQETHLVLARAPNGECTSVRIPLRFASVLAGYIRPWGVMGVLASAFVVLAADDLGERVRAITFLALSVLVCAVGWLFVGRLSGADRARRELYRSVTEVPVDPALLPDETRRALSERLHADLGARATSLARAGYREAPAAAWQDVALDPAVTDVEFLRGAAVLARLEARDAEPGAREILARVHDEACRKCRLPS